MTALGITPLTRPGFSVTPEFDGNVLKVMLKGNGDMDAIAPLGVYLRGVQGEADRLSAKEVCFDFQQLYFMNSSCFKAFVTFIDTAKTRDVEYVIRFLTDPNLHWQRRSLEALRRLAPQVVSIDAN